MRRGLFSRADPRRFRAGELRSRGRGLRGPGRFGRGEGGLLTVSVGRFARAPQLHIRAASGA